MEKVEWKKFNDYATYTRGITYNKSQETDNSEEGIVVFRANNITLSTNNLNFDDLKLVKKDVKVREDQWLKKNDILICAGSGSKEHVGKVAFIEEDTKYTFGGFMAVIRAKEGVDSRYLYHNFVSTAFREYLVSALNSTTINNLNLQVISEFEIPLPSLTKQREIVTTLDSCTSLIAGLRQELTLRKKQYEYYREKMLSVEGEWKRLGEIGTFTRGNGLQKSDFTEEGVPCIHYGQIHTVYGSETKSTVAFCSNELAKKLRKAKKGDLLIATTSEDVEACCKAVVWLGEGEVAYSTDSFCFSHNQNPKYMAYLFQSEAFAECKRKSATGAKVVRVSGDAMAKFEFKFPPLSVQQSIVERLDAFEGLISALSREVELREKQYEHLRERLLSFG